MLQCTDEEFVDNARLVEQTELLAPNHITSEHYLLEVVVPLDSSSDYRCCSLQE
jgi:hypothetical protein